MKQKNELVAIYAGSFDPITRGHLDIIERALHIFDKLIIAVGKNITKKPLFSVKEQVQMIKKVTTGFNVEVVSFQGLLVDFAKKHKVKHVIRGLRVVSDFDYEFQMATLNRNMYREFDSVFLMTDKEYFYLSSTKVKEIAFGKGDISAYVPKYVEKKLREKLK